MKSATTVTADTLARLGAERLARILLDLAEEQPAIKRRLRLELAGEAGGERIATEIGKRLTSLRAARSFIDWQKRPDFLRDLDHTRSMIRQRVGEMRPDLALDLMWRFLGLAERIHERVDDSSGAVGDLFRAACQDLGLLAAKAGPDPGAFAARVFDAVTGNDYGAFDGLVRAVFLALGKAGVAALRQHLAAALAERPATDGYDSRATALRSALQDLADGEGDVDAYIALVPQAARSRPAIAAGMGRRLLAAGRAAEALAILQAGRPTRQARRGEIDAHLALLGLDGQDTDWEDTYLDALEATGQPEAAQRLRWSAFEERLSVDRLRAYLKALPDFDDVPATDRAMAHALGFPTASTALHFFHAWPEHRFAARLVLERHAELDGNLYYLLDPVARWLEGSHPLAATVLRRAMIEDTLDGAKSKRYRHAGRHLAECRSLAPLISDLGGFQSHEAFVARLRAKHGRKTGFWALVSGAASATIASP